MLSQNEDKLRFGPELSWDVGKASISMDGPHERRQSSRTEGSEGSWELGGRLSTQLGSLLGRRMPLGPREFSELEGFKWQPPPKSVPL